MRPERAPLAFAEIDPTVTLPFLNLAELDANAPPERQWLLTDWVPANQVTLLAGAGSTGKSLLAQQLATCVALGRPFLGARAEQGVAIYVSCEDDRDELHRRHHAICNAMGVTSEDFGSNLLLSSLAAHGDNALATFTTDGSLRLTKRYDQIVRTVQDHEAAFLALDNLAHLFAGNENARADATAFLSMLNALAVQERVSILLLAHPSKGGAEYSGSTAWENAVRSRLLLSRPDAAYDPDKRTLSRSKANYAAGGKELHFRWIDWAFHAESELSDDTRTKLSETSKATAENAAFLACLKKRSEQGLSRAVGPKVGPSYAPSQFEGMPEAKGIKRDGFKAAMERLCAIGAIEAIEVKRPEKGRSVTVLREVPERTPNGSPNASRTLFPNVPEPTPNAPRTHPAHTLL